jgi:long-chain acyl-CoA synthetase
MSVVQHIPETLFSQCKKFSSRRAFTYPQHKTGLWFEMTWAQYLEKVCKVAGWLKSQGIKKGDRVALISGNRPEWFIVDMAILSIGAVSVPIYSTLAERDVTFILEHAQCEFVFCDDQDRANVVKTAQAKTIVLFEQPAAKDARFVTLKSILEGTTSPITTYEVISDSDMASIIYTSGTTGTPKGVVHTHGTFRHAMGAIVDIIQTPDPNVPDIMFSFLPLSHVAERMLVEMGSLFCGCEVGFANSIKTVMEDMGKIRPTILLCVPRLWEKIYEKVKLGLTSASPVKKTLFSLSEKLGGVRLSGNEVFADRGNSLSAQIGNALVGKKIRTKLGMDRCRMVLTGSAPTRSDVMKFFASFGLCIREVYGLTENLCLGTLNDADHMVIGSCGKNFVGGETRIAADGEIQFKAPWNFTGYYKNEAATAEAIIDGGWFATGDLGSIDDKGYLRIVGRKKELLKTSGGKFIAPVPIEDLFKADPFIGDAMVVGDDRKYCVVLISFDTEVAGAIDPKSKKDHLLDVLNRVNQNLASYESIKKIGVMNQPFSVENGTLTPTLKLKRSVAVKQKASLVEAVYASTEMIVYE